MRHLQIKHHQQPSLNISVDSGAFEHYFNDTPGLKGRLSEYEFVGEPGKITTPRRHELGGDATGFITGMIVDEAGGNNS